MYTRAKSVKETTESDFKKIKVLKQYGKVIVIYGCKWKKLRRKFVNGKSWERSPKCQLSSFYYRPCDIKEEEILEKVYNDQFEGLLLVDLDTPMELKKSFMELNIGTIFARININPDMLSGSMKRKCENRGYTKFNPQLSMVFKHDEYLCTSDLLKMYKQE